MQPGRGQSLAWLPVFWLQGFLIGTPKHYTTEKLLRADVVWKPKKPFPSV